ncbi:Hypothetical predicted protein [Olea europaea subsp. europaea]|uniref:Uncharacterized protein n=1 Tax=Olea europaea subsp. europaea TaxID=158383 RepID=A0A8S0UTK8_OLEEU|nr:Hypothetical predicted protein [Olea europaea subsp. europaea]
MADFDFEPPSFSLGLDFDLDSGPGPEPSPQQATFPSTTANLPPTEVEDDDFESLVKVPVPDPPRAHKRLRCGPKVEEENIKPKKNTCRNVDDEIEDFSSEEDRPPGDLRTNSVCSSSKFLFRRPGILKSHVSSEQKSKKKEGSSASASVNVETGTSNLIFPKLTVSPLRRFQLIDSDSDDPSAIEDVRKEANLSNSPLKNSQSNHKQHAASSEQRTKKASENEDFWKDFCSEKSFHIPTPAFDEVCREYFGSVKDKSRTQNNYKDSPQIIDKDNEQQRDMASLPPAHRYFFHMDPRIQKLVQDRLPHFFPIGAGNSQGYRQQNASVIDYMGQFSHGESSRQTTKNHNVGTSSTRTQKNVKKSSVGEISQESENWVNPKSCARNPKDAGKRRVHAVGKPAGWYTGSNGQRVS